VKVLTHLESFIPSKIFYIPGNHDAISLFEEHYALTDKSENIHKRRVKLTDNLQLIGLGGSLPGYQLNDENKLVRIWESYPYPEEINFENDLSPLIKENCTSDVQTLLITHNGPSCSSTTKDLWVNPKNAVNSGSTYLTSVLEEKKWNIIANLHGHTHAGVGKTNIGTTQVINPGALLFGCFGIVKLVQKENAKGWIISTTQFIDLSGF